MRIILEDLLRTEGDLAAELQRPSIIEINHEDEENDDWLNPHWQPPSRVGSKRTFVITLAFVKTETETKAGFRTRSDGSLDILNSLVNIYGSLDLFIKEFQLLLADRLLQVRDYNAEDAILSLEMLKVRFGEQNLQACDVMIKDIATSKRIDDAVTKWTEDHAMTFDYVLFLPFLFIVSWHSMSNPQSHVHVVIKSHLFWPSAPEADDFKLFKDLSEYFSFSINWRV